VKRERGPDQLAVADLVDDQTTNDDAEAKSGEAGTADGAELRGREAELFAPIVKNTTTDRKTDAGREDGPKAGPKKALRIGSEWRVIDI